MIRESRISKNGQITIPKEIREKLGLKTGDKIILESVAQGILVRKKEESDTEKILNEVGGMWKDHPLFKDKVQKKLLK